MIISAKDFPCSHTTDLWPGDKTLKKAVLNCGSQGRVLHCLPYLVVPRDIDAVERHVKDKYKHWRIRIYVIEPTSKKNRRQGEKKEKSSVNVKFTFTGIQLIYFYL